MPSKRLSEIAQVSICLAIAFVLGCQIFGLNIPLLLLLAVSDILIVLFEAYCITRAALKRRNAVVLLVALNILFLIIGGVFIWKKASMPETSLAGEHLASTVLLAFYGIQCSMLFIAIGLEKLRTVDFRRLNYWRFAALLVYIAVTLALNPHWRDAWPQYDNYTYSNALDKHLLVDIFQKDGLLLAGHVADIYSLCMLVFRRITNNFINAPYLLNMVLMVCNMLAFEAIIRRLVPNNKNLFYFLSTLMFGLSPVNLGSVYIVCPEKILVFGILLYIYGLITSNYLVNTIAVFAICTAKETGLLIVAAVTGIQVLVLAIEVIRGKKNRLSVSEGIYYGYVLLLGLICGIRILSEKWTTNAALNAERLSTDGHPWNSFAFSINQAICVLKGVFLTNFTWIFLLMIAFGLIMAIRAHGRKRKMGIKSARWNNKPQQPLYCIIITVIGIVYLISLCIYITGCRWRYYMPVCAMACLLGVCALGNISTRDARHSIIKYVSVSIAGVLLFAQCYITLDPVMLGAFTNLDTGKGKIVCLDQNCDWMYDKTINVGTEYNRQIYSFTKALDRAFGTVLADRSRRNACVLFSNEHMIAQNNGAITSIMGLGYEYIDPPRWPSWSYTEKIRYLADDDGKKINVGYIGNSKEIGKYQEEYDNVYYIEMPWADSIAKKVKQKTITSVEYMDWKLYIYKFF